MSSRLLLPLAQHRAPMRARRLPGYRNLRGSDLGWAIAFIAPFTAVFVGFVVYPLGYALWLAGRPSLYTDLLSDPLYFQTLVNTLLFVGIAVNLKMFSALLLSGFFLRQNWWVKALFAVYVLPWALAAVQACISFHWMLIGEQGLVDGVLSALFGIDGPLWFNNRWLGLASNIVAYIWKWMPFWTVIFLAARLKIPREIYDAAAIDGATGWRSFRYVTFPRMANLYLLCTLVSALWTVGDFTTVYLVSSGGPAHSTEVLATLGYRYAFENANPALGVAAVISILPVLIPIVVLAARRLQSSEARQ